MRHGAESHFKKRYLKLEQSSTTNEKVMEMTCIITIFTPDKAIISEDSAVSSENRTYTGVEKTIPLSSDPPMTMSYYGNSDFDDIPLENIASEYLNYLDLKRSRIPKIFNSPIY